MSIKKTAYDNEDRYLPADAYDVKCGDQEKRFQASEKRSIGEWIKSVWEEQFFFPAPAYVYMRIPNGVFTCDDSIVLLCKYEKVED